MSSNNNDIIVGGEQKIPICGYVHAYLTPLHPPLQLPTFLILSFVGHKYYVLFLDYYTDFFVHFSTWPKITGLPNFSFIQCLC